MVSDNQKRTLAGLALLLFALYLGWLGIFYHRLPEEMFHAPRWLIYLLALLLSAASGLAFIRQTHPLANLLAAVVWFLFAALVTWAALFSPMEGFSGGSPLLSLEVNRFLARILFGLGSIFSLVGGVYAVRRIFRKQTNLSGEEPE